MSLAKLADLLSISSRATHFTVLRCLVDAYMSADTGSARGTALQDVLIRGPSVLAEECQLSVDDCK